MKGPNLATMAWRNLWRNRRRTLLTLSSIAFGVMLAVLFTGTGRLELERDDRSRRAHGRRPRDPAAPRVSRHPRAQPNGRATRISSERTPFGTRTWRGWSPGSPGT